jgi:3-oxoacyl-[acyl-carrier protein] reductase
MTTSTPTRRTALVTGSSRGIGRATVLALATRGFDVAVHHSGRSGDEAGAVASQASATGARTAVVHGDVADAMAVGRFFGEVEATLGPIDVVVSNAGVTKFGRLDDIDAATVDVLLGHQPQGGLQRPQRGCPPRPGPRSPHPHLERGHRRRRRRQRGLCREQGAGEHFTKALSKELGSRGITANSVLPGITDTDGLVLPQQAIERLVAQTPLGRIGAPEDVADVIAFLASEDARWITGQTIRANGGLL